MHNAFPVKVVTPDGTALELETVEFLKVPSVTGEVGVLPNHSPSLVKLGPGEVQCRVNEEDNSYFVSEGLAHLLPDQVLVLAPFIDSAASIDVDRAKAAKKRAEDRLSSKDESVDRERARTALIRAESRLRIALAS
jgi:F-type H+-transporting ATPase subunit epsilon